MKNKNSSNIYLTDETTGEMLIELSSDDTQIFKPRFPLTFSFDVTIKNDNDKKIHCVGDCYIKNATDKEGKRYSHEDILDLIAEGDYAYEK